LLQSVGRYIHIQFVQFSRCKVGGFRRRLDEAITFLPGKDAIG
jgi:hypothetical protein